MRGRLALLRPWPYAIGGLLVGFLFLGEFAMNTNSAVQIGLLVLAVVGLAGVVRRVRALELWPLFVAAAMVVPLMIDVRLVGLPRCGTVPQGVACLAGTRDVSRQFASELLTFAWSVAGVILLVAREIRAIARGPRR